MVIFPSQFFLNKNTKDAENNKIYQRIDGHDILNPCIKFDEN